MATLSKEQKQKRTAFSFLLTSEIIGAAISFTAVGLLIIGSSFVCAFGPTRTNCEIVGLGIGVVQFLFGFLPLMVLSPLYQEKKYREMYAGLVAWVLIIVLPFCFFVYQAIGLGAGQ